MLRKMIIALAATVLLSFTSQLTYSQDVKRWEAGGQVSLIRVPTFTTTSPGFVIVFDEHKKTNWGFGGRIGYNFNIHVGIEGELNYFPQDRDVEGGKKLEGLFGVKAGKRFEKVGIFAKARPGFVRFSRGDYISRGGCVAIFPPPVGCFQPEAKTHWAADVGGIFEAYPSQNTIIRFDIGDTIIRLPDRLIATTHEGPREVVVPRGSEHSHNLQINLGVGFRF
jgi:hypothetical protein